MKRKVFLTEFLGALGAEKIEWLEESANLISGKVVYDHTDPEEVQDFCWHKSESEVPDDTVLNLIRLINNNSLLSIDKLIISREELRHLYNSKFSSNLPLEEFSRILETLEEVEVPMMDEGKETDAYFIHE